MRFLVDECTGPAVASWLRDQSHDVFSYTGQLPDAFVVVTENQVRFATSQGSVQD